MKEINNQLIKELFPYLKYVVCIILIIAVIIGIISLGKYIYEKTRKRKRLDD